MHIEAMVLQGLLLASSIIFIFTSSQVDGIVLPVGEQPVTSIATLQNIQATMKAAVATLYQETNLCNHFNRTVSRLVSEGRLVIPQNSPGNAFTVVAHIPRDTEQLPVTIMDILPSVSSTNMEANSLNVQLLSYLSVDTLTFNCINRELSLQSRPYGTQTVIPGLMELHDMNFLLGASLGTPVFMFSGDWTVGTNTVEVDVHSSNAGSEVIEVSSYLDNKTMPSSFNFSRLVQELTHRPLPVVMLGAIEAVEIHGDSASGVAVIGAQIGDTKVYLAIQRAPDSMISSSFHTAIAVETSHIRFDTLIQQATGLDLTSVPYINSLVFPSSAVIYASDTTIASASISRAFSGSTLLGNSGEVIQQGTTAYIQVGADNSALQLVHDSKGTIEFRVAGESFDIETALSSFPGVGDHLRQIADVLPDGIDDVILNLDITRLVIDTNSRVVSVDITFPKILAYFDDVLTIENPTVIIDVGFPQINLGVTVNGHVSIAGIEMGVTISHQNIDDKEYVLQASASELRLPNLLRQFSADILPTELVPIATKIPFVDFVIQKPTISFQLTSSPLQIYLTGQPIINGFTAGPITCLILKQGDYIDLIEGFELTSVNLAELLGRITPAFSTVLRNIPFLNQDIDTTVLISPESLPNIRLSDKRFKDFSIEGGLSLRARIPMPTNCLSDPFCAVAQSFLGSDSSFMIQGTIQNPSVYSLNAGVNNIPVGNGITVTNARLEIRIGVTTEVGIAGGVLINDPKLNFDARIAVRPLSAQVVLELRTNVCVNNMFGLPYLTICNLHASVTIVPGSPLPSGLALGGEARLGIEHCGNVITASGYVGLDTVAPQENYYYVNFPNSVTLSSLLQAFCITGVTLPAPIADTGFPHGFMSSFAFHEKVLPHVPLTIPHGFRLNGTVNVFGLTAYADITVGLPRGLAATISLPAINIGNGLLVMSASSSNTELGPTLHANISLLPSPIVNIEAHGYLSVMGISVGTVMRVTNNGYEFSVQGRMLNLFSVDLTIAAPHSPVSIQAAPFRVRGSFRNDLTSAIQNLLTNTLRRAADEATTALAPLRREVENARSVFTSADRVFRDAQRELSRAQGVFDAAVREVNNLQNRVNNVCHTRSCGSVCVGCITTRRCCAGSGPFRVCSRCPHWNNCCNRITDPTCEAQNAACRALKAPILALLDGARRAVDTSRVTLNIAREAFQAARLTASAAQTSVDIALGVLHTAEQAYRVGLQAVDFIARFAIGGVVDIRRVTFDVSLGEASTGRFSGSVEARFLGNAAINVGIDINLNDIAAMARQLADRVVVGLSGFFT